MKSALKGREASDMKKVAKASIAWGKMKEERRKAAYRWLEMNRDEGARWQLKT